MVTFVEAAAKTRRTAGVIPLHGRKALPACARPATDRSRPRPPDRACRSRRANRHARQDRPRVRARPWRGARHHILQRLPACPLHLAQPRRLPRHPDERPLREGDILNIDLTLIVDGWHGDSSRMYPVGEISRKAERLIEVTYASLDRASPPPDPATRPATSARPSRPLPKRSA